MEKLFTATLGILLAICLMTTAYAQNYQIEECLPSVNKVYSVSFDEDNQAVYTLEKSLPASKLFISVIQDQNGNIIYDEAPGKYQIGKKINYQSRQAVATSKVYGQNLSKSTAEGLTYSWWIDLWSNYTLSWAQSKASEFIDYMSLTHDTYYTSGNFYTSDFTQSPSGSKVLTWSSQINMNNQGLLLGFTIGEAYAYHTFSNTGYVTLNERSHATK